MGFGTLKTVFWFQSVCSHADSSDINTGTACLFECFNYELTCLRTAAVVLSSGRYSVKEFR